MTLDFTEEHWVQPTLRSLEQISSILGHHAESQPFKAIRFDRIRHLTTRPTSDIVLAPSSSVGSVPLDASRHSSRENALLGQDAI